MKGTDSSPSSNRLPTLSVVIPAYNEEAVIISCLDALAAQREHINEVIVVDNNSTDKTEELVRKYVATWPAVRLISEPHPGVVSARNAGLNAAKGDIIARIDADTVVSSGWALAYRRFFADPSNANVGASTGIAIPYDLPFPRLSELVYRVFILQSNRLANNSDTLFGTNMAIRRQAWRQVKDMMCRKEDIMEDMDVSLHVRQVGKDIKVAPDARVAFSARRMLTNPVEYFIYARMWPMTYWHHGKKLTAIFTWPFTLIGCLLQTIAWPLFRAYDPDKRRLSLRRLFSRQPSRMIPKGS